MSRPPTDCRTLDFLRDLYPEGAIEVEPFDWTITEPAWSVGVGVSEERLLELGIPREAFLPHSDCWQVITRGSAGASNVHLAEAMGPDIESARIRLMGQLDILRLLATGPWRPTPSSSDAPPP